MIDAAAVPLALGGLALSSIFATLHMALLHSARTTLADIASDRDHDGAQSRVHTILADMEGHSLAQGLLASASALLAAMGMIAWTSGVTASSRLDVAVGLIIVTPLLWMVAVVLPTSLAEHASERLVYNASTLIRMCHRALMPVVLLSRGLDEAVRRLIAPTATGAEGIEADLLSVVEEGRQEGQFDERERDMIAAVVQLRTTSVQEVMTPRTEIDALAYTDDLSAVKAFARSAQHSRIPVYEDNLDHVVGVLYAKDLLHYLAEHDGPSSGFELRSILRPAAFVPETKSARDILADMLDRRSHLALIADEYGGTAGLVTVEDIIEEVFGDILDEYETEEDDSPSIDIDAEQATGDIDARAHIDDLNEALAQFGVSLPESDDYDTLGGCIMVSLGHIPVVGESLQLDRVELAVTQAEPTRVLRVSLRVLPKVDPSAAPTTTPAAAPAPTTEAATESVD